MTLITNLWAPINISKSMCYTCLLLATAEPLSARRRPVLFGVAVSDARVREMAEMIARKAACACGQLRLIAAGEPVRVSATAEPARGAPGVALAHKRACLESASRQKPRLVAGVASVTMAPRSNSGSARLNAMVHAGCGTRARRDGCRAPAEILPFLLPAARAISSVVFRGSR